MIELKNVVKKYANGVVAIEDLSLKLNRGELIVLKGVSGSGKSTILSLIAGLSKPSSGDIVVDDKHISKLPDHFAAAFRRDNIGFIFQKYNLISSLSVAENILLPLYPLNLPKEELEPRLQEVLNSLSIEDKRDRKVKDLSGGEQQRVAIARASINNPNIILADEPTANLDEKLSLAFIKMLEGLKASNRTVVVATHDPLFFDLESVDRVIEIRDGKVV